MNQLDCHAFLQKARNDEEERSEGSKFVFARSETTKQSRNNNQIKTSQLDCHAFLQKARNDEEVKNENGKFVFVSSKNLKKTFSSVFARSETTKQSRNNNQIKTSQLDCHAFLQKARNDEEERSEGSKFVFARSETTKQSSFYLKISILFLLIVTYASCHIGALEVNLFQAFQNLILQEKLTINQEIFFNLRLPRILLAIFVGASLAVSGCVLQSLFRNPLAEPSLIGVLSGGSLFVALTTILFEEESKLINQNLQIYLPIFAAFLGAILVSFLVFKFAKFGANTSVSHMLLAGIAINSIAFAALGLLIYLSNDTQMRSFNFWMMGSLSLALWPSVLALIVIFATCFFFLIKKSRQLDVILLGENEAKYLGIDFEKLKKEIVISASLLCAACIAVSGPIGFVGLVIPHITRIIFSSSHRFLIPVSAVFGSILLLFADAISRTIIAPAELPVGILTALIGGPYFLFLLIKQKNA
jgi:iron complex transport system permease protein